MWNVLSMERNNMKQQIKRYEEGIIERMSEWRNMPYALKKYSRVSTRLWNMFLGNNVQGVGIYDAACRNLKIMIRPRQDTPE